MSATTLDLDGEGPLWQQIRRAIERPIASGEWRPGHLVPSEFDLMERYGAARMTVNRAIRSLAGDGLVERRRKRGTIVAQRAPERPVFEIWDIAAEVERAGNVYSYDVLECDRVPEGDPRRSVIGVSPRSPLQLIVCRHFSNGEPIQLEERLINLVEAPQAACETFTELPPGRWLLQNVSWVEAEHTILAEEATPEIADWLKVKNNAACLVVERRTWNERSVVTYVRLWHPGDRRRLVGRFSRAYS